jgi:uncharacterized protein with HEPN domain
MDNHVLRFLDTVVDSISIIEEHLAGIGYQDYKTDRRKMIIVVENFETILEALHSIPQDIKDAHPDIDWESFDGFRARISDPNHGINEEEVWSIAKMKLTKLKKLINQSFF